MRRTLVTMLLLLPAFSASAQADLGYRVEHPDGTVEFTDESRSGGEPIVLEEVPTIEPPPPIPRQEKQDPRLEPAPVAYQVRITSPDPETTFLRNEMDLTVEVVTEPRLQAERGHRLQIELDGETVATGSGARYTLGSTVRGSHQLLARVVDEEGRELGRSDAVTFNVRQNTRLIAP